MMKIIRLMIIGIREKYQFFLYVQQWIKKMGKNILTGQLFLEFELVNFIMKIYRK